MEGPNIRMNLGEDVKIQERGGFQFAQAKRTKMGSIINRGIYFQEQAKIRETGGPNNSRDGVEIREKEVSQIYPVLSASSVLMKPKVFVIPKIQVKTNLKTDNQINFNPGLSKAGLAKPALVKTNERKIED